jgi:hypothetical protein
MTYESGHAKDQPGETRRLLPATRKMVSRRRSSRPQLPHLFGLPCIAAVIVGHVALAETKDDAKTGRGMAVAGLVLGYVALAPAIIFFLWLIAGAGLAFLPGSPTATPTP